eukprot:NODE_2237_length_738_cov_49.867925_g1806_i0.p1 GENE.NODE_2237_length_738_cov_49.867925_g1806_i0~~NODE_2237_length_738_cov_49.867925_g1806_i0.p1  ORF type:complete len:184 (-),score=20.92 NODE_2237_length_738_cov_49.867925_g1806_i0:119-670(-)
MSFGFSRNLTSRVIRYQKSLECCEILRKSSVQGRHEGISVTYNGTGVVEHVDIDPSFPQLFVDGKLDLAYIQRGVCQAILDANAKMNDMKQLQWVATDPQQQYEPPHNLPPFPFEHPSAVAKQFSVSHLPDVVDDESSTKPIKVMRSKHQKRRAAYAHRLQQLIAQKMWLKRQAWEARLANPE